MEGIDTTSLMMALAVAVGGCAASEPEPAAAVAALLAGAGWELRDARGGRELWVGPAEELADQTDHRPARPMELRAAGEITPSPEPVHAGRLVEGGVVWVTVHGELLLDRGGALEQMDVDVLPELDVAPDGRRVAYARRPGREAGVWIVSVDDAASRRRVSVGLAVADRPLFLDAERLLLVGARASGVAGVWIARHVGRDPQPTPLTNAELAPGQLDERFVPPPADHRSMRVVGGALEYHDGETRRRLALPEVSP